LKVILSAVTSANAGFFQSATSMARRVYCSALFLKKTKNKGAATECWCWPPSPFSGLPAQHCG